MKQIGRNEECWCGSGKKYKKCHLGHDANKEVQTPSSKKLIINNKWIRSESVIERMRKAGVFNGELMDFIRPYIQPEMNTEDIDNLIEQYTRDHGHIPACKGYKGFPKSSCISINDVVCHGIPSKEHLLKEGDIVNIDLTTIVDGAYGDQSETFFVGLVSDTAKRLTIAAANSLVEAISVVAPDTSLIKIGEMIEKVAHQQKFSVVRDYTGHGISTVFHEDPPIFHFRSPDMESYGMASGMTFTIEPMINEGDWRCDLDTRDKWTVRTADRKLSAQFEHTILVIDSGFEILTLTPSQKRDGVMCHLATSAKNKLR